MSKRSRCVPGRRLIAVDIENVIGGTVRPAQARQARSEITTVLGSRDTDQLVIGVSPCNLLSCWTVWPGPRYVVRSGKDGADLALLEVLTDENIEARFDEVVLISGDGIFTDAAADLGSHGVRVTVLANPGRLSTDLWLAATDVRPLRAWHRPSRNANPKTSNQRRQPVPAA